MTFKYMEDLYKVPMTSSNLYIYYVKSCYDSSYLTFHLNELLFKAMLLPHKDGYAVIPINHTIT